MSDFILNFNNFNQLLNFQNIFLFIIVYILFLWGVIVIWLFFDIKSRYENIFFVVLITVVVTMLFFPGLILYIIMRPKHSIEEKKWILTEQQYMELELKNAFSETGEVLLAKNKKDDRIKIALLKKPILVIKQKFIRRKKNIDNDLAKNYTINKVLNSEVKEEKLEEKNLSKYRGNTSKTKGEIVNEEISKKQDLDDKLVIVKSNKKKEIKNSVKRKLKKTIEKEKTIDAKEKVGSKDKIENKEEDDKKITTSKKEIKKKEVEKEKIIKKEGGTVEKKKKTTKRKRKKRKKHK